MTDSSGVASTAGIPTSAAPTAASRRTRVEEIVFGVTKPRTLDGVPRIALLGALVVAGFVIAIARTPMHSWNVLWAEDGAVFIPDALVGSPLVIFEPYAGYMHLVPRISAMIAAQFPLQVVPLAVTIAAALVISLAAAAGFAFLETRIRSIPLRLAAWIAMLALPIMGAEAANNLANLHWYLMVAAFCAVVIRARSTAMTVVQCVVVVAAVMSDPLTLLLLPVVAFRWWLLPSRRDRSLVVAFITAGVIQLIVVLAGAIGGEGRPAPTGFPTPGDLLDFYSYRVVLTAVVGLTRAQALGETGPLALPGLATAAATAVLIAMAYRDFDRRVVISAFGAGSILFAAIVYSLQWTMLEPGGARSLYAGDRYAVVPTALLIIALVLAADAFAAHRRRSWARRVIGVAVLIAIAIPVALDYRSANYREGAPPWDAALQEAAALCDAGDDLDGFILVRSAPLQWGGVLISCTRVTDAVSG